MTRLFSTALTVLCLLIGASSSLAAKERPTDYPAGGRFDHLEALLGTWRPAEDFRLADIGLNEFVFDTALGGQFFQVTYTFSRGGRKTQHRIILGAREGTKFDAWLLSSDGTARSTTVSVDGVGRGCVIQAGAGIEAKFSLTDDNSFTVEYHNQAGGESSPVTSTFRRID